MKWIIGWLFGRTLDRLADEAVAEFQRLSHCHVCGACICNQHDALSDDTCDQQRRICRRCVVARRYQSKIAQVRP